MIINNVLNSSRWTAGGDGTSVILIASSVTEFTSESLLARYSRAGANICPVTPAAEGQAESESMRRPKRKGEKKKRQKLLLLISLSTTIMRSGAISSAASC